MSSVRRSLHNDSTHHPIEQSLQSKILQEILQLWEQLRVNHETEIWRKSGSTCSRAPGTTCHLTPIHHKQLP